MELKQLRYFLRVIELGSMRKAAQELGIVTSTLSQQISRLESRLSTRLLQRTSTGVIPTAAGLAFGQEAQLAIRHADNAALAAQSARITGRAIIGLAPTTAGILALPFFSAMQKRYPDVQVQLVESLSGNLVHMLSRRQIDLAVIFHSVSRQPWSLQAVLEENLLIICHPQMVHKPPINNNVTTSNILNLPLVLPSSSHGLRSLVDSAFAQAGVKPNIVAEVDGLSILMDIVCSGHAATIHPGAAAARPIYSDLLKLPLNIKNLTRRNLVASLSDDELAPTGLAARNVLIDVMRNLVQRGDWPGAILLENS